MESVTEPPHLFDPSGTRSAYNQGMDLRIPTSDRRKLTDPFALYQSSALPYKTTENGVMICLITSRKKQRWVFPKASLEGLDPRDTARRAVREKAGLSGQLSPSPIGRYRRLKDGQICEVLVYGLEVDQQAGEWSETLFRYRKWVEASKAADFLVKPELQDMLGRVLRALSRSVNSLIR